VARQEGELAPPEDAWLAPFEELMAQGKRIQQ